MLIKISSACLIVMLKIKFRSASDRLSLFGSPKEALIYKDKTSIELGDRDLEKS